MRQKCILHFAYILRQVEIPVDISLYSDIGLTRDSAEANGQTKHSSRTLCETQNVGSFTFSDIYTVIEFQGRRWMVFNFNNSQIDPIIR